MNCFPLRAKIAQSIASNFRVDRAKSPEILQKEGLSGSEIAARNRKSLATFHYLEIASDFWGLRWASQSQKSLRFRCAKLFSRLGDRQKETANGSNWFLQKSAASCCFLQISAVFCENCDSQTLGVLSHHLKCEMKSPHLVDCSWDFVDFQPNLSQILANF